jgi:hypothetical protein
LPEGIACFRVSTESTQRDPAHGVETGAIRHDIIPAFANFACGIRVIELDVASSEQLELAEGPRTERFGLFERHHCIAILCELKKDTA